MSIPKENLDERIERIKRQAEQIEKKHREAEEDRLMALKMNALVTKSTLDDENWPKAHKYDDLDFTYDVDPEKLEESNKAYEEQKNKTRRDYKKFAEGEGPPPDPKYNFLADTVRDGTTNQLLQKNEKFKQNISNYKNKDQFNKRNGNQNNNFRGGRGNGFNNNNKGLPQNPKSHNKLTQPEQWRTNTDKGVGEEIKSNNNRQNQRSNEKWKREWDNEKLDKINSSHEANSNRSPKHTAIKNISNQNHQISTQQNQFSQQPNSNSSYSQAEYMIEKRGNITVSVSQSGEVKSVKLSSAPAIGTGRVGPRQLSKTNFQIQAKTLENDVLQRQYIQNTNKDKNEENPEFVNNNLSLNTNAFKSNNENFEKFQPTNTELKPLQNLLQQNQPQLLEQQHQQSQQLVQQQNLQTKYNSLNLEVPKFSQNTMLQQNSQEILVQKQREQLHQQQQQQLEQQQQQLLLQRQNDQQQYYLIEQQKHQLIKNQQQQEDLKHQALIQQLHHQQQKESMQQRQNLLKQQKKQQQQSQSSIVPSYNNKINESNKANAINLITKSPKKDKNYTKNNFPINDSKNLNTQLSAGVGMLQVTENNNTQNNTTPVIDAKILDTVVKELSSKPEFVKRSVQDRLLRIRQNSSINSLISSNSDTTSDNNDLNADLKLKIECKTETTDSETIICK